MSPNQAAIVIQSAWKLYREMRQDECMAEYNNELWDMYYRQVYPLRYHHLG